MILFLVSEEVVQCLKLLVLAKEILLVVELVRGDCGVLYLKMS